MKTTLLALALAAILGAPFPALAAGKGQPMTIPDFTKGGTIPKAQSTTGTSVPRGCAGGCFATRW